MSASAQVLANRQNSLHSTGPVTAVGKAKSSCNALRHGLTSKQIVIPGESAEEYDAFRDDMLATYAPAGITEQVLVEELCAASWRLLRARGQETAILARLLGDEAGLHAGFATLFIEKPKEIARLTRYITTIERAYYRALNKLEKIQEERRKAEQAEAARQSFIESVRERQIGNGFVSQNEPIQNTTVRPAAANVTNQPLRAQAGSN